MNIEGILTRTFDLSIDSGFLNQLYAPLFFIILGFSFSINYYLRLNKGEKKVSIIFLSTIFLTFLMVLTSIRWLDFSKLLRDLTYLWLIYLIFQVVEWRDIKERFIDKDFIQSFAISFIIVFPLSYILYESDLDIERFSGWVLSKPQFANMVFLSGLIYLNQNFKKLHKHIVSILCLILIFASGTRTTLILFVVYYGYYFLILNTNQLIKRVTQFIAVTAFLTVILYWIFMPYIDFIIEMAGNYRAFSFDDIEDGSIFSRFSWYSTVFQSLYENNLIGGFGAGASEKLLGLLTHFDFLRFWYDYTILFSLVFTTNLFLIYYGKRRYRSSLHKYIDGFFFLAIIFALMAHNVFQSFTMVIMIMLFMLTSKNQFKNEFSGRVYRVSVIASPSTN